MAKRSDSLAKVTLAREPDTELSEKISAFVRGRGCTGVCYTIDPKIVGGIIIGIGDTILDGSVRGRLEHIKQSL